MRDAKGEEEEAEEAEELFNSLSKCDDTWAEMDIHSLMHDPGMIHYLETYTAA